jgi:hypothetical protein
MIFKFFYSNLVIQLIFLFYILILKLIFFKFISSHLIIYIKKFFIFRFLDVNHSKLIDEFPLHAIFFDNLNQKINFFMKSKVTS